MVFGTRILAGQPGAGARRRGHLPDRIRRGRATVPGAHRRARNTADTAISGRAVVLENAEPLSPALFRSAVRGRLLARRRGVGGHRRRRGRPGTAVGRDADVAGAVGALPFDRQRRADLVWVRLGVVAAGVRGFVDLPPQWPGGAPRAV